MDQLKDSNEREEIRLRKLFKKIIVAMTLSGSIEIAILVYLIIKTTNG